MGCKIHGYRHPRTTAERRANQDGWCRGKRKPHSLPNTYDDLHVHSTKNWKDSRKTQYRTNGRGKHHSIKLPHKIIGCWHYDYIWILEEYFKSHNIPYRIDNITEPYWYKKKLWKRVIIGARSVYHNSYSKKNGEPVIIRHFLRREPRYSLVEDGYKMVAMHYVVAHDIHWWSNKDIGIEYILKG